MLFVAAVAAESEWRADGVGMVMFVGVLVCGVGKHRVRPPAYARLGTPNNVLPLPRLP